MHRVAVLVRHAAGGDSRVAPHASAAASNKDKDKDATHVDSPKDQTFLGGYGMMKTLKDFGAQVKGFAHESLDFHGVNIGKKLAFSVEAMNRILDNHHIDERRAFQRFLGADPQFSNKHHIGMTQAENREKTFQESKRVIESGMCVNNCACVFYFWMHRIHFVSRARRLCCSCAGTSSAISSTIGCGMRR